MICTPFTVFIYSSFKVSADQCGEAYQYLSLAGVNALAHSLSTVT